MFASFVVCSQREAPQVAQTNPGPNGGENRAHVARRKPKEGDGKQRPPTAIPTISDVESTRNEIKPDDKEGSP